MTSFATPFLVLIRRRRLVVSFAVLIAANAVVAEVGQSITGEQSVVVFQNAAAAIVSIDRTDKMVVGAAGFFVSADGKLIANRGVVKNAATIIVRTADGRKYPVSGFLAEDSEHDLVLLKCARDRGPCLSLNSVRTPRTNDLVRTIGLPSDWHGSVVRLYNLVENYRWMELETKKGPRTGGIPLLNNTGNLVGVMVGSLSDKPTHVFAVLAETVKRLVETTGDVEPQPFAKLDASREDELFNDEDYKVALPSFLRNQTDLAIQRMTKTAARFPRGATSRVLLGSYYAAEKQYTEAIAAYREALDRKPDYPLAMSYLAGALAAKGDYEAAIKMCQKALELKPDHAEAWRNLSAAYIGLKDYGKAWDAADTFRILAPAQAEPLEQLLQKLSPRRSRSFTQP